MANSFLKPEVIVATALGLLRREIILPGVVQRYGIEDFRGAKDDTINVRVPARLQAREYGFRNNRASAITTDEISELSIPVVLNKMPYSAVAITDEELTLDIRDFATQVLQPQILAVAEKLETYIAAAMAAASYAQDIDYIEGDGSGSPFYNAAVDARKALNDAKVPMTGRVILLGSSVEAAALKEDGIRKVNESGTDSALREAVIARVAGFTVIGNIQAFDPDFAIAMHPSAFAFANVAPIVPDGAAFGSSQSFENLALRWLRDYDSPHLQDRSVVSAFAGAASVEDGMDDHGELTSENVRAVKLNFTPAGS